MTGSVNAPFIFSLILNINIKVMKKTKLTYADIEMLQFALAAFQDTFWKSRVQTIRYEALRIKLIVMRAEIEYLKNRESV